MVEKGNKWLWCKSYSTSKTSISNTIGFFINLKAPEPWTPRPGQNAQLPKTSILTTSPPQSLSMILFMFSTGKFDGGTSAQALWYSARLPYNYHCSGNAKKVLVNYDAIWWMFWNQFFQILIMGLSGEIFSQAEIEKIKNIGFYIFIWRIFTQGLVVPSQKIKILKQEVSCI